MMLIIALGSMMLLGTIVVFSAVAAAARFDSTEFSFDVDLGRASEVRREPILLARFQGKQLVNMNDLRPVRTIRLHSE